MGAVEDPFGLAGTTLERRFAIDRVVARGGFGVVYQGRHITLKKPVAVKVLFMPEGMSLREKQVFLEGFEREAQTIAQLEHPAIVRAYDFGIARPPGRRELPWLALEWIEGESLAERLEGRGASPMPPTEALTILRPVFQGLAFAHAKRIAHRDIKPANIMLVDSQDAAQAGLATTRLLDFGIAKVMSPDEAVGSGSTRTMAAFSAFSTPYAAPEQKGGLKTGPWTDVHAIGLILTQMLTGRAPYPGDDPVSVELAIMAPTRPTPGFHGVDVGPWEPVLAKAVSLHAPDRFQDAGSFLAALEAATAGASVTATRAPTEAHAAPRTTTATGAPPTVTPTTALAMPPPALAPATSVPGPVFSPTQAPMAAPAPAYAPIPSYQGYTPPYHAPAAPPPVAPSSSWTLWRALAVLAGVGVLGITALCVIGLAVGDGKKVPAVDGAIVTAPPPMLQNTTTPTLTTATGPADAAVVNPNTVGETPTPAGTTALRWSDDATQFRGRDGERVGVFCPPGGTASAVWGSGTYTDDSSICTAAVHAGLATFDEGGAFTLDVMPGRRRYRGSSAHGVTTLDFAAFPGSFALTRR